jgi:tetratricopeptide (TPR) repeat protein
LAHPDAANHPAARSEALKAAGQIAQHQGDLAEARVLYEERLAIERDLGNRSGVADTLWLLADVSDRSEERTLQEERLSLYRQTGDTRGMISALISLGDTATGQDDPTRAGALYEQAVAVAREQQQRGGSDRDGDRGEWLRRGDLGRALQSLGQFATEQGQYERAHACYQESLRLWQELNAIQRHRRHAGQPGLPRPATGGSRAGA